MNELSITVAGWVATEVRMFVGQGDLAIASFRVASTPRYFDRERSQWVDGVTEWFTVRVFRSAAVTVHKSIKKGQPVVVTGRLRTSSWEAKEGRRTDLVVDATAVGHDCTRGTAEFTRAIGDPTLTPESVSAAAEAIAADRATGPSEDDAADPGDRDRAPGSEPAAIDDLDLEEPAVRG